MKIVVAFLAVAFWPLAVLLFQMYLSFFNRLHSLKDWFALLVFDILSGSIAFIVTHFYVQDEKVAFWTLYGIWGVISYFMMLALHVSVRTTNKERRRQLS